MKSGTIIIILVLLTIFLKVLGTGRVVDPTQTRTRTIRLNKEHDTKQELCIQWITGLEEASYEWRCTTLMKLREQLFSEVQ